jgi:glycosyltransferase involved in cell wall biosynthesis
LKILIAATAFSSEMSGTQRHAFNLARCLLQRPDVSAVHFAVASWQRNLVNTVDFSADPRFSTHVAEMDRTSVSRNVWYYRQLPKLANALDVDIAHLSYPMPVNSSAFTCPTVVTLHDLYPYEIPLNFGFPKFIFNRLVLQQCLRNVDAIACVSDTTMQKLGQYAAAPIQHKAVRVYNCVEPATLCAIDSPIPAWRGEPFLLCVAQHRRNKNISLLLRVFDRLLRMGTIDSATKLVMIGIDGPETKRIHRLVSLLGLNQNVVFLAGLAEPELQWCYARCKVLVAPSSTEGFGLPIAEALLAGCRVVCSDIPAFREVGGDHCRFIALRSDAEEHLANAILAAIRETANQPVPFPQLSAPILADQYINLYRALLGSVSHALSSPFSPTLQTTSERRSL